jgi:hypothetical protein
MPRPRRRHGPVAAASSGRAGLLAIGVGPLLLLGGSLDRSASPGVAVRAFFFGAPLVAFRVGWIAARHRDRRRAARARAGCRDEVALDERGYVVTGPDAARAAAATPRCEVACGYHDSLLIFRSHFFGGLPANGTRLDLVNLKPLGDRVVIQPDLTKPSSLHRERAYRLFDPLL